MLPVDVPYNLTCTMDLGAPISYLVLEQGTEVFSSDQRPIGRVGHVLADEREDVFDGIVITRVGIAHGHVFADADEVAAIYERGVVLTLDQRACERLPEPSANPAVVGEDPGDRVTGKLRRAWDRLSGNY
ncbi:MAG: hypothetical protein WAL22_12450 [Solirubrobacteraceae bacterium]